MIASNRAFPGRDVGNPSQLDNILTFANPKYIFFPFWSWKIPKEVFENFNCVGFHMTDLPFGRGGHPYENLRRLGIWNTKMSAFKITDEWDAGDIYLKRDFTIHDTKQKTIDAAIPVISEMIAYITANDPTPTPQVGEVTKFGRIC